MENVHDIAAAFVAELRPLETYKLEKLVYYAQAWWVAAGNDALFADAVEAWENGPVVNSLYQRHKARRTVTSWPSGDPARLSAPARKLVADVIARYGHFTGDELSDLTHIETPWKATRGQLPATARSRRPIPRALMAQYYGSQTLKADAAVRHAVGNAALEGLRVPEGYDQVLGQVARGERDADAVAAELVAALTRPV